LYEKLGVVHDVWVESERIGRYANINSGIDFKDEQEREKVVDALTAFATALGVEIATKDIQHPWDVLAMPGTTSRQAVEEAGLAFDPEALFLDEDEIPVGKAALLSSLCPSWVGRVDLRPESQSYKRLRAYVDASPEMQASPGGLASPDRTDHA
jgi:hypothetical protein